MRKDVLGEAAEPRGVRQFAHERVNVLGVVALFAGARRAADGREAFERVGRAERQVEAEERIAVAGPGPVATGRPAAQAAAVRGGGMACRLTGTFTRTAPRWP